MAEGAGGVDLAVLGLRVDGTQVRQADADLKRLKETGAATEAQTKRLERSTRDYASAERLTIEQIRQASQAYDAQFGELRDLSKAHQEAIRWNQFYTAQEREKVRAMRDSHAEALIMNERFDQMNAGTQRTTGGIGRLNNALVVMTRQAVGANAVTGQLVDVLGTFALGVGQMTAILGGLAAVALAWRKITEEAREAREEQERGRELLQQLQREQQGEAVAVTAAVREQRRELEQFEELMRRVAAAARGERGQRITSEDLAGLTPEHQQLFTSGFGTKELREINEEHRKLTAEIAAGQQEITRITEAEAAKRTRALEEEARERERIAKEQLERDMEATAELVANARQAQQFRAGRQDEAEAEKVATFEREQRKANEATREAEQAARAAERAERDRMRAVEEQIRLAEDYAFAVLGAADALGVLSAAGGRGLASLVQVGGALQRFQQGTMTGGQVGAVAANEAVGIVSAIVESGQREREAMQRLTESLDRLRVEVFANPAQARAALLGAQEDIRGLGTFNLAEKQRAAVEAQELYNRRLEETTRLFRGELEVRRLLATGQDEEAERLRLQIAQERELAEARAAGWDAATIAVLEGVQAAEAAALEEERLAEARRKAEEAARRTREAVEDLVVRAFAAGGQDATAQRAGLMFRQAREREEFAGESPEMREFLGIVHSMEAMELATREALRVQEDQLAAVREQIRIQEQTVATLRRLVESLERFQVELNMGPLSPLSPTQKYAFSEAETRTLFQFAMAGDVSAAQSFEASVREWLQSSRDVNASGRGYVQDWNQAKAWVDAVQDKFAGMLTHEEQVLAAMEAQEKAILDQIEVIKEQHAEAMAVWLQEAETLANILAEQQKQSGYWYQVTTDGGGGGIIDIPGLKGGDVVAASLGWSDGPDMQDTFRRQHEESRGQREQTNEHLEALVRANVAGFGDTIETLREESAEVVSELREIRTALDGVRL